MTVKLIILLVFLVLVYAIICTISKSFMSDYDICYSVMEDRGYAVFGSCCGVAGGNKNTEYLSEHCVGCPYLVLVDDKGVDGND